MIIEGKLSLTRRLLLLASALVLFFGLTAVAQEGGSGLSISPTRAELKIKSGESEIFKLTVKNVSNVDIVAKAVINDFESDNVSGEPRIIIDQSKRSPNSIRQFFGSLEDIPLKKDESKVIELTAKAPDKIPSGAYYGVIRYTAVPVDGVQPDPGRVSLTASIALPVLIEVPGNIVEHIQLKGVSVYRNEKAARFFLSPPNSAGIAVRNIGNGFSKPFGRVQVLNRSGEEIYAYEMNDTDPRGNVLPNSTRVFKDPIKNIGNFGRYSVVANISHGSGGEVLTASATFWVIPWWILVLIIIVLLGIGLLIHLIYRKKFGKKARRKV